ncbi:von Willebrand factor type A domain protein [uncultured archaeon]|nr:von Willebrand factor type A domain protein [uncultured archaeon]
MRPIKRLFFLLIFVIILTGLAAGVPAFIDVNVTQNQLVVGNATVVNLTAYDQDNNINSTADIDINISITDVPGKLNYTVNITKTPSNLTGTELEVNQTGVNIADINITDLNMTSPGVVLSINSTLAGYININVSSNNLTNSTYITFVPAEIYDFDVFCDGLTCDRVVNQTVNITVESYDVYSNPANETVFSFNNSPPPPTKFNSPIEYNSSGFTPYITTTGLDGTTSTVFKTDKRAGDNTIIISAGSINKSYTIPGKADVPADLFLSHSPDFVNANNRDAYSLTAQVVDQFQNPVLPEGVSLTKKMHFIGSSQTYILLNESGAATTLIGPTLFIETVNISAVYNDGSNDTAIMNRTNLSFVPGNLSRFVFYANPDTVLYQNAKGNHNASIILKALDEWGHPIPGINVNLTNTNTTLGNLTAPGVNGTNIITAVTDSYGGIQANFNSSISVGNDTIIADNGLINASLNVSIMDKTFISVVVDFEPKNIISGQKVNVTTIISVEGDTPVTRLAANAMLVLDNTGSMDPDYYAGTPADILLLSDNSQSMQDNLSDVKKAEINFTNNLVSNDRVGLETFNGTIIGTPSLSRNITDIQKQINSQGANSNTPTASAIQKAKNYLVNNTRSGASPIIILLSDGLPTKPLTGSDTQRAIFEAINESDSAKKTIINTNTSIKIFTIYFDTGDPSGTDTLKAIASPDSYYYATSSNIEEVYDNIAQQISDFDISTRQYGTDGLTPYNYMATGVVNNSKPWLDNISLDDNVTDFKVQIDNPNVTFTMTSPNGMIYPRAWELGLLNRTGYYNVSKNDSSKGRYIWIEPVNDTYNPDQDKTIVIPRGNWTINVTTPNATNVAFNITTYIDKISAVKIASHAFISSFDATNGDRAGLVTYSNIPNPPSIINDTNQSSSLLNGSVWDGYFVGSTPKKNYTLNFTGYSCSLSLYGFGECYITVNGRYAASFSGNNSLKNYSVDITDLVLNGSNTMSFYNYSYIYSSNPKKKSSIRYVNIIENGASKYWFQNSSNVSLNDTPTSYTFNVSFNTTFNLTWPNATDNLDFYIYQGGTLLNKSTGNGTIPKTFKATIYPDNVYYVEINGTKISNETNFTITASQTLTWNSYTANVTAPLEKSNETQSFDLLNTSIDTMTAVGLTAIDEGIYAANNEFPNNSKRPTMILMTDGLDNAGYRSLLNEVNRARNNNTVIYTIGLGNNQSEIDPVLSQIANTTGGQYYFAPNTTVLKSIFRGIASNLTNLTASNMTLNLRLPNNYTSDHSLATSTYQTNSSNSTQNKSENFIIPTYPEKGNAEPVNFSIGNITLLSWNLPNLTVNDKWGVWYQLKVEGAGYVPLVLPGSNITFFDMESNQSIIINITSNAGLNPSDPDNPPMSPTPLDNIQLSANPPVVFTGEPSRVMVSAKDKDGNWVIANVTLDTNLGYFINNLQNPVNGRGFVNFTSNTAGQTLINAVGSNGSNSVWGNVVIVVKPKGKIIVS